MSTGFLPNCPCPDVDLGRELVTSARSSTMASAMVINPQGMWWFYTCQEDLLLEPKFRNNKPGDPSPILYLKNLAKAVEEEDLVWVFGRWFGCREVRTMLL